MKNFFSLLAAVAILSTAYGLKPFSVSTNWKLEDAANGKIQTGTRVAQIPEIFGNKNFYGDPKLEKTLYLVDVAKGLKSVLGTYEKKCGIHNDLDSPASFPPPPPRPMPMPMPPPIHPPNNCKQAGQEAAQSLFASIREWDERRSKSTLLSQDVKIVELVDLSRRLAANLEKGAVTPQPPPPPMPIPHPQPMPQPHPGPGPQPHPLPQPQPHPGPGPNPQPNPGGPGLLIGVGGAQDYAFFRKVVNDGRIPRAENLAIEGFLKEFDIQPQTAKCDSLVCVTPVAAVTADGKKLYVQLAMDSSVTADNFKRRPLNLSVVVDVSGSMDATDGTEKNRLEWAKETLRETLKNLGEADILSIILFNDKAETLLKAQHVANKQAILDLIAPLRPSGSTNLYDGLQVGFKAVEANLGENTGFENRVILISDAGLNVGIINEAEVVRLVDSYAAEKIGLTAIGVGGNFKDDLIQGITRSAGGNYLFAQTGKSLFNFFKAFDFLVTPVAYRFKAGVGVNGADTKLVEVYGIPGGTKLPLDELIRVETLFFAGEGEGGALVLEYDLK